MKFSLAGERIVQYLEGKNTFSTRTVKFTCEAEVQGILERLDGQKVHLRGEAGGRCIACGTKDTYPWMDQRAQRAAWEVHHDRCNYAFSGG